MPSQTVTHFLALWDADVHAALKCCMYIYCSQATHWYMNFGGAAASQRYQSYSSQPVLTFLQLDCKPV